MYLFFILFILPILINDIFLFIHLSLKEIVGKFSVQDVQISNLDYKKELCRKEFVKIVTKI